MTRPIEAVVAEAQRQLEITGRLDVAAIALANPEHSDELRRILPAMLALHEERRWRESENRSRAFALNLFGALTAQAASTSQAAPASQGSQALQGSQASQGSQTLQRAPHGAAMTPTLGTLFTRDREETGLSLDEQARRAGLTPQALAALSKDPTPVKGLDNATIKQLAGRVGASFAPLLKEIRRLGSLGSLATSRAMVFTRDRENSTDEERVELLRKVQEASRQKPPEDR